MTEEHNETNRDWKELATKTGEKLKEADAFIKKVMSPPFVYGTVISCNEDSVDVDVSGKVMEVSYNPDITNRLVPGMPVRLNPQSHAVVKTRDLGANGGIATVEEVLEDGSAVVNDGSKRRVLKTFTEVKENDRVIVDTGYNAVLKNMGKDSTQYQVENVPEVPWEKIGGLEEVIASIKDTIEAPFEHKEVYQKYGKKIPKGVLLHGPPGCGKTLIAKAIAYNLAKSGDGNIAVGFIDEAESLLGRRGEKMGGAHMDDSLVTQFLAEMDGINTGTVGRRNRSDNGYFLSVKGPEFKNKWYGESEKGIRDFFGKLREKADNYLIILATNRADIMDPAVLRPGRIDRKIRIGRPGKEATANIFGIHLDGMPIYSDSEFKDTKDSLALYAAEEFFGDKYPVFEARFKDGKSSYVGMSDLANGAMVESIAQRAAGRAIKREIAKGGVGVSRKDLSDSVMDEYKEFVALADCKKEDLKEIFKDRYEGFDSLRRYEGRN